MFELADREFRYIADALYDFAKINLTEKKRSLVISRLSRRIRATGLNSFPEYVEYLKNEDPDRAEFMKMVDAMSTNYSLFFREPYHFDFLTDNILRSFDGSELKIWSAASSTGQEIYSILMTLLEFERIKQKRIQFRLYASDISTDVLRSAAAGIYSSKDIEKVEPELLKRYFLKGSSSKAGMVKIKNELIRRVKFFRLNLNDEKFQIPLMDVIFLRNVVIYFDKPTKIELIARLHDYLKPGGYLFLGHSESLSGISDQFVNVGKTVYRRKD